jgi:hypothetical protein
MTPIFPFLRIYRRFFIFRQRSHKNTNSREAEKRKGDFYMDLKAILGEKYKDGMTADEISAALADYDPTSGMIKKDMFDRTASELAAAKKQLKEKLTADEQAKAEQDAFKQQLADLQKENQQMKLKESFVTNGYDSKTAVAMAEAYSSGDMVKFASLNAAYMADQQKTMAAKIKEDLLKGTPGIGAGTQQSTADLTKQIDDAKASGNMALAASLIRQQAKKVNIGAE